MAGLSEILHRGLHTKLADLVSLFGDVLLLILVGVVSVDFQACLGAKSCCCLEVVFGLLVFNSVGDRHLRLDFWEVVKRRHLAELLELILYLGEVLLD